MFDTKQKLLNYIGKTIKVADRDRKQTTMSIAFAKALAKEVSSK